MISIAAMMARQRHFEDSLYGARPDETARQSLARKRARQARQIKQWTMLSLAGLGAIAGLVWLTRPTEIRAVGASTDAFSRDDGRGRILGAGRSASIRSSGDRPERSSVAAARPAPTKTISSGGGAQEQQRRTAGSRGGSSWAAGIEVVSSNEARLAADPRSTVASGGTGFRRCTGGASRCVIDGGRFKWGRTVVELADVEVPNPKLPACQEEAVLGARASVRLAALLNEGPFHISAHSSGMGKRGAERHIVTRDGVSIGTILIEEGLARRAGTSIPRWC